MQAHAFLGAVIHGHEHSHLASSTVAVMVWSLAQTTLGARGDDRARVRVLGLRPRARQR